MTDWFADEQRRIVKQLLEGLKELKPPCVALLGEFRMGRAAILHVLWKSLPQPRVYLSLAQLSSADTSDSSADLYRQIMDGLRKDWGNEQPDESVSDWPEAKMDGWEKYSLFEKNMQSLTSQPLTIILDDAEYLADVSEGTHFFRNFRYFMDREPNIRVVLAGTSRLKRWAEDMKGKTGLWGALIEPPIRLEPIKPEVVQSRYRNHPDLAQHLIKLCGGHPYCLQRMAENLPQDALQADQLQAVKDTAKKLKEEWKSTFQPYWEGYNVLTRRVCFLLTIMPDGIKKQELRSMLKGAGKEEIKQALDAMKMTGILFEDEQQKTYRLIGLFYRWYKREVGFADNLLVTFKVDLPHSPTLSAWNKTFDAYWGIYNSLVRRVCFLLTVTPTGLQEKKLKSKLGQVVGEELQRALETMITTNILIKDKEQETTFRLTEVFRRWYKEKKLQEVGFVDNQLTDVNTSPSATPSATEQPTTELTFFPDHQFVLIRRHRFLFQCKFELSEHTLTRIRKDTKKVLESDRSQFWSEFRDFSQDLWHRLKNERWFQEVIRSVDEKHRFRFNIPSDKMGDFPFELLPLDDTGTIRIGTEVPISRQLIKQGRDIERAPLILPQAGEKKLRVLIVASEVEGNVLIDPDGRVYTGQEAESKHGDSFKLEPLRLHQEVEALHQILRAKPQFISEVRVLARNYNDLPTAKHFEEVLRELNNEFDILHFTGHGLVMSDMKGGLLFEDRLVHLTQLKYIIENHKSLRFVYLSCCESASQSSGSGDLLGLAHACVEGGVPAVLGMRWRISPSASQMLAKAFYEHLFNEYSLDKALHAAIKSVNAKQYEPAKKVYAAAPVLIMH